MRGIEKYDNLKDVMPKLQEVLVEAIQSEFLEIKKINKECEKFIAASEKFPELKQAEYVIFSQYIKKNEHKHEMFVFIDAEGGIVQYITGCDMELYGLLTSCAELHESDEFVETTSHSPSDDVRH